MRNALIDIGSNTIRLVVYDGLEEIYNEAHYAELIKEVSGGKITEVGIIKLFKSLSYMKQKSEELNAENIYAFATASLRDIEDKDSLINEIKNLTGIEFKIISSEKEAYYDFLGLKSAYNINEGLAFDLGGGSCQLMSFSGGTVRETISVPIGSLKLHSLFVKDILPTEEEQERILEYTSRQISVLKEFSGYKTIHAMGGAIFALSALSDKYLDSAPISEETLMEFTKLTYDEICEVVPKRVKAVIPASLTMMSILQLSGAKTIVPAKASVRDGIIYEIVHKYI